MLAAPHDPHPHPNLDNHRFDSAVHRWPGPHCRDDGLPGGDVTMVELPFPPASLSGHNTGHYRVKAPIVAKHREWATKATLAVRNQVSIPLADNSDIRVSVTFYPPDRRGDRVNYPNRMKPYWDGIADALGVNDRRFLPSFHYALPVKKGRVVILIGGQA